MSATCNSLEFIERVDLGKFINSKSNKIVDTGKYRLSYGMYRVNHVLNHFHGNGSNADIYKLSGHSGIVYDNAPDDNQTNIELGNQKFVLNEIITPDGKTLAGFVFKDGKNTLMITSPIH